MKENDSRFLKNGVRGEVLWVGKPYQFNLIWRAVIKSAISSFFLIEVISLWGRTYYHTGFLPFIIPIFIILALFIMSPLFRYISNLKTIYLISDQEAVLSKNFLIKSIKKFPVSDYSTSVIYDEERDIGSIFFEKYNEEDPYKNLNEKMYGFYRTTDFKLAKEALLQITKTAL